jgi:hypothetical protein
VPSMNSIDKRIPLISHQDVDAAIAAGFVAAVVVVLLQMPSLSIFQIWITCIHIVQQSSLVCLLNIFDILAREGLLILLWLFVVVVIVVVVVVIVVMVVSRLHFFLYRGELSGFS